MMSEHESYLFLTRSCLRTRSATASAHRGATMPSQNYARSERDTHQVAGGRTKNDFRTSAAAHEQQLLTISATVSAYGSVGAMNDVGTNADTRCNRQETSSQQEWRDGEHETAATRTNCFLSWDKPGVDLADVGATLKRPMR